MSDTDRAAAARIAAALADAMDADGGWSPDVRFTVRSISELLPLCSERTCAALLDAARRETQPQDRGSAAGGDPGPVTP